MAYLVCTRAVLSRARIDHAHLPAVAATNAVLGNWYVTIGEIDRRNALVFMSESTLLSFLMFEETRIDPAKLTTVFVRGLDQLLVLLELPRSLREQSERHYSAGRFARASDLSILGLVNSMMLDYRFNIEEEGGFSGCSVSDIICGLNFKPQKRLNFRAPVHVAREVAGAAT